MLNRISLNLRSFSSSAVVSKILKAHQLPPRPKIDEDEIMESFIKGGSGAGGQKINKTNSKVQLTHIPTGIVVESQATRSRDQNRKIARQVLAQKVQDLLDPGNSRTAVLIDRKSSLKARQTKKTARKYKLLDEEKKQKLEDEEIFIDEDLIEKVEKNSKKQRGKNEVAVEVDVLF